MSETREIYAAETKVPAERSRQEALATLKRYGVVKLGTWEDADYDYIGWQIDRTGYSLRVPRPKKYLPAEDRRYNRDTEGVENSKRYDQYWRAINLLLKAALEFSIFSGQPARVALLPYAVTADGRCVGDVVPELESANWPAIMPKDKI